MTIEEYISDLRYYNETGLGAISSYDAGEIADALEGLLSEYNKVVEKLALYEDAKKQGRLIILPHKIGDRVFLAQRGKVHELEIRNVTSNVYHTQDVENGYRDVDIYPNDFGRYIFQTHEEAERALQEARSGENKASP